MKIIGATTTYTGHEVPGLTGARVRIFSVLRDALRPGVDVDVDVDAEGTSLPTTRRWPSSAA